MKMRKRKIQGGINKTGSHERSPSEKESSFNESQYPNAPPAYTNSINQTATREVDTLFWGAVAAAHAVLASCLILLVYWGTLYQGYAWNSDPKLQFNWHPLLMVLGLVFFYGDAILMYRVLHFLPKWILKLLHAGLNLSAAVLSSIGLVAVFENHRRLEYPDLYSLHSWVGLITFGFFCLQFVGSFVTFLYPGLPSAVRARVMPFHTFFGVGIFFMAVCSAELGMMEKLGFTKNYSALIKEGVIGNIIGLLLIVFAFLVIFIVTREKYKRKPLPSDSRFGI